jgi:hypothetical protein
MVVVPICRLCVSRAIHFFNVSLSWQQFGLFAVRYMARMRVTARFNRPYKLRPVTRHSQIFQDQVMAFKINWIGLSRWNNATVTRKPMGP